MTCDSGRHAKRGDAKQAPSARMPERNRPKGIAMTTLPPKDKPTDAEEALADIRFGMEFAYEKGLHEFGYDPVAVVTAALTAKLNSEALVEALVEIRDTASAEHVTYRMCLDWIAKRSDAALALAERGERP